MAKEEADEIKAAAFLNKHIILKHKEIIQKYDIWKGNLKVAVLLRL